MAKPTEDKNIHLPDSLIRDLLTDSEIRMVKQRYLILSLLEEGLSIRAIASKCQVGTDTVVRITRLAERRNLKQPSRGKRTVKKTTQSSTTTSWVFGKSN